MPDANGRRLWPAVAVALAVIVVDQLAKVVVRGSAGRLPVWLFDHVGLEIVHNSGISFSRFAGREAIVVVAVAAVVVALAILIPFVAPRYRIPLALILGGAAGNLIDRLRFGYVLDYVKAGPWPTFNVADIAIAAGAVAIAVLVLFPGKARE